MQLRLLMAFAVTLTFLGSNAYAINEFTMEFHKPTTEIRLGDTVQTLLKVKNNEDSQSEILLLITQPSAAPQKFWVYFSAAGERERSRELEIFLEPGQETFVPIDVIGAKSIGTETIEVAGILQSENLRDKASATLEFLPANEKPAFLQTPELSWTSFAFILVLASLAAASAAQKKTFKAEAHI